MKVSVQLKPIWKLCAYFILNSAAPENPDCSNDLKRLRKVKNSLVDSDDEVWDDSKNDDKRETCSPTIHHYKTPRKIRSNKVEYEKFANESEDVKDEIVDSDDCDSESEDDNPPKKTFKNVRISLQCTLYCLQPLPLRPSKLLH